MKIKSQKDFCAGIMFAAIGTAFAVGATNYTVGNAARMGPGYFPLILGIIMALLGCAVIFSSTVSKAEDGDKVGKIAWRPLGFIIGANFVFGVLLGGLSSIELPAMGMIIAIYALTFIASAASNEFRFRQVFILATILAVGSYFAFVVALKLQFPVWPTFITG
ncbi:MAG: tripartite tricarboxylate transporter TctB family protein [Comamonadaceae bacterium]|nr:MAG: tripartite tricarboxylate transporter TctB family protein [Comamonadaceae bacterium]